MKVPKSSKNFHCKYCDYNTSRQSQFDRHLMTAKHRILTNPNEKSSALKRYYCDCGKAYKHVSSLCAHKKICHYSMNDEYYLSELSSSKPFMQPKEGSTNIVHLIKQNEDFKTLLLEQQKENQHLQRQLIEVVKDGKVINNTTNNNQKFNLNFFLNTTCKDAMNMTEFIETMEINYQDMENIGKHGYITGMTDMIISRIRDLDITKRPLHCTDLKRETMYIKDNDEWSKDTSDNLKLRNMITIVAKQNYNALPQWREENPECNVWDHPRFNLCMDMMRNMLGDVGNDHIRMDNKIIKNLSRHILVEKN